MSTYLFIWKPGKYPGFDLQSIQQAIREQGWHLQRGWGSTRHKNIGIGDRFFLLQAGDTVRRGVIGSGYVASNPIPEPGRDRQHLVDLRFDDIRDIETDPYIKYEQFLALDGRDPKTFQTEGIEVADDVAERLEELWHTPTTGRFWIVRAGEGGMLWDRWAEQGLVTIGWHELGELTECNTIRQYQEAIQAYYQAPVPANPADMQRNTAHSLYDFMRQMQIGDLVFAVRGTRTVLGAGRVTGPYLFLDEPGVDPYFMRQRQVSWQRFERRDIKGTGFVQYSVKEIPSSDSKYSQLKDYWGGQELPNNLIRGELEGMRTQVVVTQIERNPENRRQCLEAHGTACLACGFEFHQAFKDITANPIHAHHLHPLGQSGVVRTDPKKDMIPLCPNCHTVAHLQRPKPFTLEQLRSMRKVKVE